MRCSGKAGVVASSLFAATLVVAMAATPARAVTRHHATAAAAHYATERGYRIGIAVIDTTTHALYTSGRARTSYLSASVVKVLIAARLLVENRMHGDVRRLAYRMITQSDNDAANQLYPLAGGSSLEPWTERHFHVPGLGGPKTPPEYWGSTRLVPAKLARLYVKYKNDPRVGPWLLNAMHHIHEYSSAGEYQWWGLPSATTNAAVKQGWNTDFGHANVNTTGFVNNDRYAVVIMSRGPTSSYLEEITEMITQAAKLLLPHGHFPAPRPVITGVSPVSISTAGGWHVTVRGTSLTHVTQVLFGDRPADRFTSVGPGKLDAVAPAHPAGAVNIRVVTSHGLSRMTPADVLRFVRIQ
jgi:hypothetical protein